MLIVYKYNDSKTKNLERPPTGCGVVLNEDMTGVSLACRVLVSQGSKPSM